MGESVGNFLEKILLPNQKRKLTEKKRPPFLAAHSTFLYPDFSVAT